MKCSAAIHSGEPSWLNFCAFFQICVAKHGGRAGKEGGNTIHQAKRMSKERRAPAVPSKDTYYFVHPPPALPAYASKSRVFLEISKAKEGHRATKGRPAKYWGRESTDVSAVCFTHHATDSTQDMLVNNRMRVKNTPQI